jgi:hypothetical protein
MHPSRAKRTVSEFIALKGAIGCCPGSRVDFTFVSSRPCPGQDGKGETRQSEQSAQSAVDGGELLGVIVNGGQTDLQVGVCCVRHGESGR